MSIRVNSAKWLENQKRWQIKVQKNGIRKTFTCSIKGRKGQRIANEKADKWLNSNVIGGAIKFNDVIDMFLAEKALYLKPRSVYKYEKTINKHIRPYLGFIRVENITEQIFQNILNNMYDNNYSLETIKGVKIHLLQILGYARKCGYTDLVFENLFISSKKQKNRAGFFRTTI